MVKPLLLPVQDLNFPLQVAGLDDLGQRLDRHFHCPVILGAGDGDQIGFAVQPVVFIIFSRNDDAHLIIIMKKRTVYSQKTGYFSNLEHRGLRGQTPGRKGRAAGFCAVFSGCALVDRSLRNNSAGAQVFRVQKFKIGSGSDNAADRNEIQLRTMQQFIRQQNAVGTEDEIRFELTGSEFDHLRPGALPDPRGVIAGCDFFLSFVLQLRVRLPGHRPGHHLIDALLQCCPLLFAERQSVADNCFVFRF